MPTRSGYILSPSCRAVVAEWLRRLTRNQIPSGSVGSNPTDCEKILFCQFYIGGPIGTWDNSLKRIFNLARLAQSVEHETLNLRVVGSSPTLGETFYSF